MKRRLLITGLAVSVIAVGFGVIHWAGRPSSTSQSNVGSTSNTDVLGSNTTLTPFVSPYFSTQIPSNMQLKTNNENPQGAIRAGYLFTNAAASPSDQIAITVGTMGLNRLSEIPGVKQRLNNSETYLPTVVANTPDGSMSFKKVDGYETAVFWQQDNLYVALVASGSPLREAELDQMLQSILSNWSWR